MLPFDGARGMMEVGQTNSSEVQPDPDPFPDDPDDEQDPDEDVSFSCC